MPAPGSADGAPHPHCWKVAPRHTTAVSRSTLARRRAFHGLSPAAVHRCSRPRLPRSDRPPPSPGGPAAGPRAWFDSGVPHPRWHRPTGESGFDHGAGHPLLFLDDAKAPNCQKNNGFNGLGNYSEWPKVAGAVIQALLEPREFLSFRIPPALELAGDQTMLRVRLIVLFKGTRRFVLDLLHLQAKRVGGLTLSRLIGLRRLETGL